MSRGEMESWDGEEIGLWDGVRNRYGGGRYGGGVWSGCLFDFETLLRCSLAMYQIPVL